MRDFYPGRSQKFYRRWGNLSATKLGDPWHLQYGRCSIGGTISTEKQGMLYRTIYRSQNSSTNHDELDDRPNWFCYKMGLVLWYQNSITMAQSEKVALKLTWRLNCLSF